MKKIEPEFMSKNAYAKYLGVDEKAVRNAVLNGKIKKGYDVEKKKIIKHIADKEFGFAHKIDRPKAGVSMAKLAAKMSVVKSPNRSDSDNVGSERSKGKDNESDSDEEKSEKYDLEFATMTPAEVLARIIIHPELTYNEALRRNSIVSLCQDKMRAEEAQGVLVKKELVYKTLYAFGTELKNALMAIPARVIEEILIAPTKVDAINMLKDELISTLQTYADFDKVKINAQK